MLKTKKKFIEKIDKQDYIYSQFETNYTMDGTIVDLISKDESYPKMAKIIMKIDLMDEISFL